MFPPEASSGDFENPPRQSFFPKPRKKAPRDRSMPFDVEMGQFGPISENGPDGGGARTHVKGSAIVKLYSPLVVAHMSRNPQCRQTHAVL